MFLTHRAFLAIPSRRFVAVIVFLILIAGASTRALGLNIQIGTIQDLQKIGNDPAYPLNGSYVLTQDIDASATATWNNGAGFVPIGNAILPFAGVLDGHGHVISGLTINDYQDNCIGLIGFMGPSGQVKNLGLWGGAVAGAGTRVGGLVGENYGGAITQCYATDTVSSAGSWYVGGLVGLNAGMVTQCYATGAVSVSGRESRVGGLIGLNITGIGVNPPTVTQCHASGTVSSAAGYVGGLIGENFGGTLIQSCATGAVSGGIGGGLVAVNTPYTTVSECYATGAVSGTDRVGGLIGTNGGAVTTSYWDVETSGQTTSAAGTGESTAAMMTQATFAGWDFTTIWDITEGQTYPFLRAL